MPCAPQYDDPRDHFSAPNFSLRLAKCPRTHRTVSYSDIGDPDGVPLLYIVPSACSRWVASLHDPLCRLYGVRMIAVDRPGCGATPRVPISERFEISAQMAVSVLEHLGVRPRHVLATSAGIYHTLQLLIHCPEAFDEGVRVYFVSPWAPHSADTTSLMTRLGIGLVPNGVFETQHITGLKEQMPYLIKIEQYTGTIFNASSRLLKSSASLGVDTTSTGVPVLEDTSTDIDTTDDAEASVATADVNGRSRGLGRALRVLLSERKRLHAWQEAAIAISSNYLQLEESRGISDELLLCLNRTQSDTGPEWFRTRVAKLAASSRRPVDIGVWFGGKDPLVSIKAQRWLVDLFEHAGMKVELRNIKDANHDDLLKREEGIWEVMELIRSLEDER